ncbi:MAG: hypothetical protein Q8K46_04120, partial [Deltaproteobacteria bacterium]|nr:hypothetical protein [Deltaproteobacteria bacterium]
MSLAFLAPIKGQIINFLRAELVKKYQALLILLAITAIAYALVGLCYDLLSFKLLKSTKAARPVVEEAVSLNAFQREPADAYAVIPQRNLFGSTEKAVAGKKLDAAAPVEGPD